MEIKAVFFDIDGTLVNDSKNVLASTEEAIRNLKAQGILVGLATGRGPFFVKPFMEQLDLDFAVTYNGSYILTREGLLASSPIDKGQLSAMVKYAHAHRKELALGTADAVLGSKIMSFGMGKVSHLGRFIPRKWGGSVSQSFNRVVSRVVRQRPEELEAIARQPIYQMHLLATKAEINEIAAVFPDLKFTRSSPFAADVINAGVSKLEGIKKVGETFGFGIDEVMAFGDSDNDLEMLSGVGLSIAMGNGSRKVKEVAKHTTSSNTEDGISKALEHFGILAKQEAFVSEDPHFNKVKEFHSVMDGETQECPIAWQQEDALHRSDFKIEEIVEFVRAASASEEAFDEGVAHLHAVLDKAADKVRGKIPTGVSLTGQVDALVDVLYLTYGSFALMGVDPEKVFDIVHEANMGKIFPDGKAHYDPVTHKILKPDDWEEKYAPEPAIRKELARQLAAYTNKKGKAQVKSESQQGLSKQNQEAEN